MNVRRFPMTFRIAAGLLVAGGVCLADLAAQERTPPPTPEGPRDNRQQETQERGPQQGPESAGVGLGVDLVTTPQGVFVSGVREDSPAANVGLRRGDQIVSFAGERVSTAEELLNLVRRQQADSTAKAEVRRNGERVDMAIVLGSGEEARDRNVSERAEQQQQQQQQQNRQQQQQQRRPSERQFGPRHESLFDSPQQQRDGKADNGEEQRQTTRYQPPGVWAGFILERAPLGVVIEQLHPQGPARRVGLRAGDRIVRVNGQVATAPDEVYQAIEQRQPGDEIRLTVLRGEELIEGSIRVEEPPPGVMEQPADGAGGPDLSRLAEQQRQNTQMIRELMQEIRALRQEIEDLRSGGNRGGSR